MKKIAFLASLLLSSPSFATMPNIIIDGTIPSQVTLYPITNKSGASDATTIHQYKDVFKKDISLLHIILSPQAKANLAEIANKHLKQPFHSNSGTRVQLGMRGLPVFDQGHHGSCATFATTAAIDVAYGKGDYISQLCNLELGSYLHQLDASYYSGWDGSYNSVIINQIRRYGAIPMVSQVFKGCSGTYIYPLDKHTSNPLPIEDFTQRSVNVLANISTKTLLSVRDAFTPLSKSDMLLTNVKNALKAGNRVIISTLLDTYVGENGVQGQYGLFNDSWILTPEIAKDASNGLVDAGHALVAIGFDDEAVITGPNNTKHQGVITLRNSWSLMAGNFGNYYMSYDYFTTLVYDAIEVQSKL